MIRREVPVLSQAELLQRLNALLYPTEGEFTSEEDEVMLFEICLNCPDPGAAMDVIVEAPQGSTADSVLLTMLNMPARSPASYTESELSLCHPLRHWRVRLRAV